jgi:hypothetical protein
VLFRSNVAEVPRAKGLVEIGRAFFRRPLAPFVAQFDAIAVGRSYLVLVHCFSLWRFSSELSAFYGR